MAIRLQSMTNVTPPGGNYPYGNVKDDDGSGNGTPVNKSDFADMFQFFAKLLADAGITGNDLPENSANTFQYILALRAIIDAKVLVETTARGVAVAAEASTRSGADTTLQGNINSEASTRAAADTSLGSTKANKAQAAWTALPLASVAWSTHAGSYHSAEYMVDEFGQTHLRGVLDVTAGTLTALLSAGWMSASLNKINKIIVLEDDNAGTLKTNSIDVQPNGSATLGRGVPTGSTISLDGVSFWTY